MGLNIGNVIQQLRHQHGVGQGELAEALGISAQAVSKWETGKANPDLFLLPGLAGYFGVSIDSLFEGVQDVQELPRKAAEQLEVNYQGWTELTKNDWRGTLLPNYGPYTPTEDQLHLFGDVRGKAVLEIGCGCGESLSWMKEQGPHRHFDLVFSIYGLGWTTDPDKTMKLIGEYLKPGGRLIFSWDNPLMQCIDSVDGRYVLSRSYVD